MTSFPWCKNLSTFYLFCVIVFLGSILLTPLYFLFQVTLEFYRSISRSRGGAWGVQAPPYFLDQTGAQRAKKNIFGHLPLISGSGWLPTPPPPHYLKVWVHHWGSCAVTEPLQSNPVDTDTGGVIESVRINWVSVLSRLNWEKMSGLSFPRDKANCP